MPIQYHSRAAPPLAAALVLQLSSLWQARRAPHASSTSPGAAQPCAQLQADPSLALPHPGAHPRTCSVAGLSPGGHGIRLRVLPDCPCVAARPLGPPSCIVMLATALTRTLLVNLSPNSPIYQPTVPRYCTTTTTDNGEAWRCACCL
jgi:hypothetical protein